jgi:hypothetical protein
VWNLSGDSSFPEKSLLIGFKVLELGLQGFHHDSASEVFVNAGPQNRLAALSQGLEIPIPHKAISDVLGQVPIGIGHQNIIGHDSTSTGNQKAATSRWGRNRPRTDCRAAVGHVVSCP